MSTLGWVVVGILAGVSAVTAALLAGTRARLATLDRRLAALDARLADLDVRARDAVRTAQGAAALARRGGDPEDEEPPPRVLLEPVTGPLVKAVAWSVGARRAATRLARSVRSEPR